MIDKILPSKTGQPRQHGWRAIFWQLSDFSKIACAREISQKFGHQSDIARENPNIFRGLCPRTPATRTFGNLASDNT